MNLLQIEIFKGCMFYVINSMQKVDIHILLKDIQTDIDKMKKNSLKNKILFRVFCNISGDFISVNSNYPIQVMTFNYDKNVVHNYMAYSLKEFKTNLKKYLKKEQDCAILDYNMDISKYHFLVFSNMALMRIISVTQQYLSYNDVCLKRLLTFNVETPVGIEPLFENGHSRKIQNPILNIAGWEEIPNYKMDTTNSLYIVDLNNCISSMCIDTGDYTLSLKALDEKQNKYTILHLKCTMDGFWSNICETVYHKEKCILLKKENN